MRQNSSERDCHNRLRQSALASISKLSLIGNLIRPTFTSLCWLQFRRRGTGVGKVVEGVCEEPEMGIEQEHRFSGSRRAVASLTAVTMRGRLDERAKGASVEVDDNVKIRNDRADLRWVGFDGWVGGAPKSVTPDLA